MNRNWMVVCLALFGFAVALPTFAEIQYAGVNLSGAEFGEQTLPGTFNSTYTWPTAAEITYYKSKGMNFIRLPFRWERLQHTNHVALDATELNRMNTFVTNATRQGLFVLLDPHNFMRYYPNPRSQTQDATNGLVGSSVPNSDFSNFWFQVAAVYRTNTHVFFGLNNEPANMPEAQLVDAENAAIAGIRAAGATNTIYVPGNRWTGAWTWLNSDFNGDANAVAMLGIVDPGSNTVFEVHQYLDYDGSGNHTDIGWTASIPDPDVGWERLTNFTAWARANNVKGFLGEFAVANSTIGSDPTQIGGAALTNMLSYIETNSDVWLGWAWWGGGPWWGSYMFTIEPSNIGQPSQADQLVMGVVKHFFPIPVPALQLVNGNSAQFGTAQGFIYQVQTSPDLSIASWSNVGSSFSGTGNISSFSISPGAGTIGFYRVQVSHAP